MQVLRLANIVFAIFQFMYVNVSFLVNILPIFEPLNIGAHVQAYDEAKIFFMVFSVKFPVISAIVFAGTTIKVIHWRPD